MSGGCFVGSINVCICEYQYHIIYHVNSTAKFLAMNCKQSASRKIKNQLNQEINYTFE